MKILDDEITKIKIYFNQQYEKQGFDAAETNDN